MNDNSKITAGRKPEDCSFRKMNVTIVKTMDEYVIGDASSGRSFYVTWGLRISSWMLWKYIKAFWEETPMCLYKMEDIKQGIPSYFITYDSTCSKILSQSKEDEELKRDMSAISWEHGRIAGRCWVWVRLGMVMLLAGVQIEAGGQVGGAGVRWVQFWTT